jgi:hypothetical protein
VIVAVSPSVPPATKNCTSLPRIVGAVTVKVVDDYSASIDSMSAALSSHLS